METNLDKWLYLLKNLGQMKDIPPIFKQPIFEQLFHVAEYIHLTKAEKMDYDRIQKYRWDNKNVVDFAREEGMQAGAHDTVLKIAREMKIVNLSTEQIAQCTKLTVEEIEKL